MKSKIIFNGFLLSIFIIMSSVIRVNALKTYTLDPAPEYMGGYLSEHDCDHNPNCMVVCGYWWEEVMKTSRIDDGDATIKVGSYATIYYKNDKWRIWFTPYPSGAKNVDCTSAYGLSSGFIEANKLFNSDLVHMEIKDWKGASTFECPNYYYPDMAFSPTSNPEVCFDNDGESCEKITSWANQKFSKGSNKLKNIHGGLSYSIFDKIDKYRKETLVLDMDCNILIDKEKYVNSDGTLNNTEIANYFHDKIAKDFMLNFLNNGDKNGTVNLPAFIQNSDSYKNLFVSLEGNDLTKLVANIYKKCEPELKQKLDDGEITPEEYDEGLDRIYDIPKETFNADEVTMKYYMTYTVKGKPLPTDPDCAAILSADVTKLFLTVLRYIQYLGPVLVVVLSTVDFIKAAASGSPDDMKKAWNKLVKRLIAAILLFFVALITRLLLSFFDITVPESCLK